MFFFFDANQARDRVEAESRKTGNSAFEIAQLERQSTPSSIDIFISYSYLDDPELPTSLLLLLRDAGFNPYLPDRFVRSKGRQPKMSDIEHTRSMLSISKSLIVLSGPKTTRSQWIPWEIGYVAGSTGKVAILSMAENARDVSNREFLQLYPSISRVSGTLEVVEFSGKSKPLQEWVS